MKKKNDKQLLLSHLKSGHPQELTQRGKKSLRKGRSRFPTLLAKCRNCKLKQDPLGCMLVQILRGRRRYACISLF